MDGPLGAIARRAEPWSALNTNLIDAVALATSHRDRDDLDRAVALMIFDQVHPQCVRVYRVLGDEGRQRVQLRVVVNRDGVRDGGAPSDPAELPLLTERDHWHECALLSDAVHYLPHGAPAERFDSVFPLLGVRGLIGLIEVEFSGDRAAIRPHDASLVQGVLRILRNHLSALEYGERDTLTGLLNRRTFETTFAKRRNAVHHRSDAATDASRGSWLAVMDIDRFKTINDTFGHLFGDEVLLLVARLMFETFRSTELIYRFGGEEFVVIVDGADEAGAGTAVERFRLAVASHRFPQVGQVTVSVGYTRVLPDDIPASAVERADIALYYAKEHGRNASHCYEALLRSGAVAPKAAGTTELELF
jgi:diguanylate cyclase (GGDEF)-like protein